MLRTISRITSRAVAGLAAAGARLVGRDALVPHLEPVMDLAFSTRSRSCAPPPPRRLIPCGFAMLELSANDPLIKTYLKDLQYLKSQSVTHELGLKGPFQTLLGRPRTRGSAPGPPPQSSRNLYYSGSDNARPLPGGHCLAGAAGVPARNAGFTISTLASRSIPRSHSSEWAFFSSL